MRAGTASLAALLLALAGTPASACQAERQACESKCPGPSTGGLLGKITMMRRNACLNDCGEAFKACRAAPTSAQKGAPAAAAVPPTPAPAHTPAAAAETIIRPAEPAQAPATAAAPPPEMPAVTTPPVEGDALITPPGQLTLARDNTMAVHVWDWRKVGRDCSTLIATLLAPSVEHLYAHQAAADRLVTEAARQALLLCPTLKEVTVRGRRVGEKCTVAPMNCADKGYLFDPYSARVRLVDDWRTESRIVDIASGQLHVVVNASTDAGPEVRAFVKLVGDARSNMQERTGGRGESLEYARLQVEQISPAAQRLASVLEAEAGRFKPEQVAAHRQWRDRLVLPALASLDGWMGVALARADFFLAMKVTNSKWEDDARAWDSFVNLADGGHLDLKLALRRLITLARAVGVEGTGFLASEALPAPNIRVKVPSPAQNRTTRYVVFGTPSEIAALLAGIQAGRAAAGAAAAVAESTGLAARLTAGIAAARQSYWNCALRPACKERDIRRRELAGWLLERDQQQMLNRIMTDLTGSQDLQVLSAVGQQITAQLGMPSPELSIHFMCRRQFNASIDALRATMPSQGNPILNAPQIGQAMQRWTELPEYWDYQSCRDEVEVLMKRPV